ncbi:MAG: hypothetical protein GY909_07905 [Oligoflexia bacterium]|nr:hypothetical protein [Oligoflexia bacterium]
MKKISLISFFTFLIIGLVVSLWEKPDHTVEVKWEKFVTDPVKKTKVVKSAPLEEDLYRLGQKPKVKTSKKISKPTKKKFTNYSRLPSSTRAQNREILGPNPELFKKRKVEILNRPKKEWKENLAKKLLRGRDKDKVSVFIKKEKSLIQMERNGARYIEQVVVSIHKSRFGTTGYRAFIDSETGSVLKTWDRTVHEYGPFKKGISVKLINL